MKSQRRSMYVANVNEVDGHRIRSEKRFGAVRKPLAAATGGTGVGCSWYEVQPGRTACPRHFHTANEEALFILQGNATLKLGDETIELGEGDYVTLPVGRAMAHEMINSGTAPLRYLCLSAMHPVEVVGYPDSQKILALARPSPLASARGEATITLMAFESSNVDYLEGERT